MSYPGQTTAYEIAIVGEERPGEEGTPLGTILNFDLTRIDKIELIFTDGTTRVIQEPAILESIAERLQILRLPAADQYPETAAAYTMTLHQADKKAAYSGNLVLLQLPYAANSATAALDEFIEKLK
jgi:hypothetical protein